MSNLGKRKPRISLNLPTEQSPFNEHTQKVFALARKEALRLKHSSVRPEHLLLGILLEDTCSGMKVLSRLKGVSPSEIQKYILKKLPPDTSNLRVDPMTLPYSLQSRVVMQCAVYHTRFLGAETRKPGTEFLLYGMVITESGLAKETLVQFLGEDAERKIRMSILRHDDLYAH